MAALAFDPFDAAFLENPYPMMARLRAESPVHYVEHLDIWAISRHADLDAVLRAPTTFSSELGLGRGWTLRDEREPAREMSFQAGIPGVQVLIGADAPAHTTLRRMLGQTFSRARLEELRPRLERVVSDVTADALHQATKGPIDLVSALAEPIAARSLALVLGLPTTIAESLSQWASDVTNSWDPMHPSALATSRRQLARHGWDMLRELRSMLHSTRDEPWDGAVGVMLDARRKDHTVISEMEILSNIVLLVLAGVHTTTCGLASTFHLLARHPDVYRAVRADSALVPGLVDESLRLESPIQASWRGTWSDTRIGDSVVPEGARIWLMFGSANRDERRYVDPDALRIGRRGPHLSFGVGAHYCIGALLATTEITTAVASVARRVREIEIAGPVRSTTNLIVRGVTELPVVLHV